MLSFNAIKIPKLVKDCDSKLIKIVRQSSSFISLYTHVSRHSDLQRLQYHFCICERKKNKVMEIDAPSPMVTISSIQEPTIL